MLSQSRKYFNWFLVILPAILIFYIGGKIFYGGSELITNLFVYDSYNAQDWSIQTNLQVGDTQFGDRTYTLTAIPEEYVGADWIRTANDSKGYDGDTLVTFQVTDTVDVLVAFDDRLTLRDWLSTWSDTGKEIVNSESVPKTFSLYIKSFQPYDTVVLGSVNQTAAANNSSGANANSVYNLSSQGLLARLVRFQNPSTQGWPCCLYHFTP